MADENDEEVTDPNGPEDDVPMSFFDHLNELRKRLVRSALGVVLAFVGCYVFIDELRAIILKPFYESWHNVELEGAAQLQALSALETFLTDLRITVIVAIFVAGPIVFYQLTTATNKGADVVNKTSENMKHDSLPSFPMMLGHFLGGWSALWRRCS